MADTLEERLAAIEAAMKLINERLTELMDMASYRPGQPDVADLRLDMMVMRTEASAANLALSKNLAAVGLRLATLEDKVDALPSAIAIRGP